MASMSSASARSFEPAGSSARPAATGTKCGRGAAAQDGVDRQDVVAGDAVAQRTRAAGIIARHAADGGARSRRDIDREPQPMGLEGAVELVEHDAGFDRAAAPRDIEIKEAVQVFG